jgi:hypothetical protein
MTSISEYVSSLSSAIGNFRNGMRSRSPLNAHRKSVRKARAPLCALWIVLWMTVPCINSAQAQTPDLATEEKLIKDFTDPLTTLPQISLKDAFTPANFGTHVQTNQVILRPIIPRVRRFSLFPLIQLIRPSFSLVTVPSAKGGTRTEFGTSNCSIWPYYPGRATKHTSRSGWGRCSCFRPRPPGVPGKAHGKRAPQWEPFTPAFLGS